jgi:hypothetical protein
MPKNSYAETVSKAQVMLSGLKAHDELARRGIDAAFIANLEERINSSIRLNNEQEKLKADLKSKTAELDSEVAGMSAMVSEAQKVVKIDISKDQWKEFGIQAKM